MAQRANRWIHNGVELGPLLTDSDMMKISGVVRSGAILIDGGIQLPEGTRILVSIEPDPILSKSHSYHVQFPLVYSETSGQLRLTNEMIADVLDTDEVLH